MTDHTNSRSGRPGSSTTGRGDGPVTRATVLHAALEIVDRDGVDGLSMRRLADAVGRDPMVVYRHVANKAAVLDGVAEVVFAQLSVDASDADWDAQLRVVARDFRRLALAHPKAVPLLVTRPLATPLGLRPPAVVRPLEDILALLTRAGFSGAEALHIYRALFGFLYGHVLNELQEIVERPEETDEVLRLGLHRLPIGEFPLLRELAPVLAAYDGATELERGLDILLTGLAATLSGPGR
ncbi:TetR/AcrR family transcriptional regulator C-terminal domain-containing protein [Nocardia sp. NBC_00565]|uniref:TetR/AcrR family transcriptional regulator C-terminal domain-containing protein n=1 Tax=Nocardia sp. NBC_00565 TaxID=2975993 RepID=UPI002E81F2FD|nr:TetR/AcrR family transcriptional regulator C-terminal domain-containing protein [Nocardia sp. NBC_00565]WUC00970.1 TetR/AcrR family transcriptional regulator C-terminal domain-containing protein [Nocardia sp. NBC_00565]